MISYDNFNAAKRTQIKPKAGSGGLGYFPGAALSLRKGIRECGLDFLVKAAEYYDVSCDYLLGRTPNRNGQQAQPVNIPDAELPTVEPGSNMVAMINKKVVMNTSAVIFDILDKLGNKKLTNAVSNYLMNAQYQAFRSVYSCEESNPQDLFTLNKSKYRSLCSAAMTLDLAMIDAIIESKTENTSIALSPDLLSRYFEKVLLHFLHW